MLGYFFSGLFLSIIFWGLGGLFLGKKPFQGGFLGIVCKDHV